MASTGTGRAKIIGFPGPPRRPPFTPTQVRLLIAAAQDSLTRAICQTAYSTALRLSELARIRDVDLDWEWNCIKVRTKTGTVHRYVDLDEETSVVVRQYQNGRRSCNGRLFVDDDGQPLSPQAIRELLNRLGERAGLGTIRGHALRRARASYWLEQMGPRQVQDQLGIEYPSSRIFRRYTHLAWFRRVLWNPASGPPPEEE